MKRKYKMYYDLETTGLDYKENEIVQFSAIIVDNNNNKIDEFNIFHATPVSDFLLELHGKTQEFYNNNGVKKDDFIILVETALRKYDIEMICGHNIIHFDNKWMLHHFNVADIFENAIITDTIVREREIQNINKYGIPKNGDGPKVSTKLSACCERYCITFNEDEAHDGLYDCIKTMELYFAQSPSFNALNNSLVGEDYLDNLNDGQREAATNYNGNYLVIAGPGTGKTHTITYRLVHMYKQGVDMSEVVVITYTRKAANELIERTSKLLPSVKIGFVGTFHGYANHLFIVNGLSEDFRLIDPEDDELYIKHVMEKYDIKLNYREIGQTTTNDKKVTPKMLIKTFSYMINADYSVEDSFALTMKGKNIDSLNNLIEKIQLLKDIYQEEKNNEKLLNYDDILLMVMNTENLKNKCKYIIIDEFQDTNNFNLNLVRHINPKYITVVGDDFQGIYGFRGSNPQIILDFDKSFNNVNTIILRENYRSTKKIVAAVNKTIDSVNFGFEKDLFSSREEGNDIKSTNENCPDVFLHGCVNSLETNETTALIYRMSKEKNDYEKKLIQNKIPYVIYGGFKLLERAYMKDVLAISTLSVGINDSLILLRCLNLMPGVGKAKIQKIMSGKDDINDLDLYNKILLTSLDNISPEEIIQRAISLYIDDCKMNCECNDDIMNDFNLLMSIAKEYKNYNQFYTDIILDSSKDLSTKGSKEHKIVLTTIHSAKGLEFDNVYYHYDHQFWMDFTEEDVRLFYVAISRAKNNLTIFLNPNNFENNFDKVVKGFQYKLKKVNY